MSGVMTAPTPDVRVGVTGGQLLIVGYPGNPPKDVVVVNVMNHSPIDLYLSEVRMETEDNNTLIMPVDLYRRTANQLIKPGNSFQFVWDRDELRQKLKG